MRRTVVPYEQRNPATLWNSQPFTAFIMSIFRRLHEYSGSTGVAADPSWQCRVGDGDIRCKTIQVFVFGTKITDSPGTGEIELFVRLGIALLLFLVGLKLDVHIIRTVGPVALLTGLGQVVFTSVIGYLPCPNVRSPATSALDATNGPATVI